MKIYKIMAVAALLALAACNKNSVQQMADASSNVGVSCVPEVLTVINNQIPVSITVDYPAAYFAPESKLAVTPVIVYEGGEAAMEPFMYQGEKVKDNFKVVPSKGGTVKEKLHFDYVEGMENCYVELRSVVKGGNKEYTLPTLKVAQGANTTYMLVKKDGNLVHNG